MSRRHLLVTTCLVAVVWLAGLAAYPLLESTEGRYASVSWGMAHGESLVEPTFNGAPLFSKPPLAYWAGALALAVLPDAEWAVRLPATLMLVVCGLLTRELGLLTGLSRRQAGWAGLFAGLSPLAFIQGHMTTGDIFLWAGVLLALYGILADRPRSGLRSVVVGLGLSLGFMAKGHMVLFWLVLPVIVGFPFMRATARRFVRLGHPLTLAVFLALTAPWFVIVLHRHPELAGYWLGRETAGRFLTTAHDRAAPWWYFLPQVPLLILPWLGEWWRGVTRVRSGQAAQRLWLAMIVVPLLIFSFSGSKRPNYLLPMVTPMALIAATGLAETVTAGLKRRTGLWLSLLLAAPFVFGLTDAAPPTRDLVRAAARTGHPLAAYRTEPSGLYFYNRAPVPVAGVTDHALVRQLAQKGYVFLLRAEHRPDLMRDLRTDATVVAERKDLMVLAAVSNALRTSPRADGGGSPPVPRR